MGFCIGSQCGGVARLDAGRQTKAFEFIHHALHSAAVSSKERTSLREKTVSQVCEMIIHVDHQYCTGVCAPLIRRHCREHHWDACV